MPAPLVKSIAKEANVSVEKVEQEWKKIKAGLSKNIKESDPKFFPILVSVLKKKFGLK